MRTMIVFLVKFDNRNVRRVHETKFLRILFTDELNSSSRVKSVNCRISRSTGAIRRVKDCLNTRVLMELYFILTYPYLNYGI